MAVPVIVEVTALRCPAILNDEFAKVTARPKAPVTKDKTREWIDRLEQSEVKKNATGTSVIKDYETCRSGGATVKAQS